MPSCVVHPFVSHGRTFCQNEQTSSKKFHLRGTKRHGNIATGIACNVVVVRRWGVETDAKRGMKYPERIINSTKLATSLMFCGSASGEILPPYVVYKAEALWSTRTENGPPGARYNRSKSSWFDALSFKDWFMMSLLPRLKKLDGKKIVIGDNLSSHINVAVLEACTKFNIAFIALPPNSTHLTQPLDVAYFRPRKTAWRRILTHWKKPGKAGNYHHCQ